MDATARAEAILADIQAGGLDEYVEQLAISARERVLKDDAEVPLLEDEMAEGLAGGFYDFCRLYANRIRSCRELEAVASQLQSQRAGFAEQLAAAAAGSRAGFQNFADKGIRERYLTAFDDFMGEIHAQP